jgi:hypothetical protein
VIVADAALAPARNMLGRILMRTASGCVPTLPSTTGHSE